MADNCDGVMDVFEAAAEAAKEFRETDLMKHVLYEILAHDDLGVQIAFPNMVEKYGEPQIKIRVYHEDQDRDIYIRVCMDGIEYTEEEKRAFEESDAEHKEDGDPCYTVSSVEELRKYMKAEGMWS